MTKRAVLLPLLLAVACAIPRGEDTSTDRAAIQGGTANSSDTFAVALLDENGEVCSGTLIAPNLVLTARHCIADGGSDPIDCESDTFSPAWPADTYRVTTAQNADYDTAPYHAKKILVPKTNDFCGDDIALVILEENVPAAVAKPATPQLTLPTSTKVVAIGYGATSPFANDLGRRRRRDDVPILCIPGHATLDCDPVADHDMKASELAAGDGLCGGDSGGGAYLLGGATPIVIGALSRALDVGPTCSDAVFARTDAHATFIKDGAKEAASLGGYVAPAWAGVVTSPTEDGGKIGALKDGSASGDEGQDPSATSSGSTVTTTSGCSTTSAPRPTTLPMLALAMAAIALRRRRGTTTRK
jgi:MYXO-CTERM domain-containing protein